MKAREYIRILDSENGDIEIVTIQEPKIFNEYTGHSESYYRESLAINIYTFRRKQNVKTENRKIKSYYKCDRKNVQ